MNDSVISFITTPSLKVLEERLNNRNSDSLEVIEKRVKNAKKEIEFFDEYGLFYSK